MIRWSLVAGAIVGVAYTLSSLTIAFGLVLVPLFWWAGRGLGPTERRWVYGVLAAAVAVRVAAVGALLLFSDPAHQAFNVYFPDARFAIARSWWIRNIWLDVPIGPLYTIGTYNPYGASSFYYVLAAIQLMLGAAPYGLNFISVAAFLLAAVALHRMTRAGFGPTAAFVGLIVMLFWPTTLAWSVSTLRESLQFALTALVLWCCVGAVQAAAGPARLAMAAVAIAAVYAIDTLRPGAGTIVAAGAALGLVGYGLTRTRTLAIAAMAVLLVASAFVLSRPAIQDQMLGLVRVAADRQRGNVETFGNGYKVLDERFYADDKEVLSTMTGVEGGRFLIRAVAAFFLVPLPWQIVSRSALAFLPVQLAWYLLIALAVPGIVAGRRRAPLLTWIFAAYVAAGVAVIAPNSGNIGTLVRHRDVVMLVLVWLSAAGLVSMLARALSRSDRSAHSVFTTPFTVRAS